MYVLSGSQVESVSPPLDFFALAGAAAKSVPSTSEGRPASMASTTSTSAASASTSSPSLAPRAFAGAST
jgi:hypothetical protein